MHGGGRIFVLFLEFWQVHYSGSIHGTTHCHFIFFNRLIWFFCSTSRVRTTGLQSIPNFYFSFLQISKHGSGDEGHLGDMEVDHHDLEERNSSVTWNLALIDSSLLGSFASRA